jgi:hypothetical protein
MDLTVASIRDKEPRGGNFLEHHFSRGNPGLKSETWATHSIFGCAWGWVTSVPKDKGVNAGAVLVTLLLLCKAACCFAPYAFLQETRKVRRRWPIE